MDRKGVPGMVGIGSADHSKTCDGGGERDPLVSVCGRTRDRARSSTHAEGKSSTHAEGKMTRGIGRTRSMDEVEMSDYEGRSWTT